MEDEKIPKIVVIKKGKEVEDTVVTVEEELLAGIDKGAIYVSERVFGKRRRYLPKKARIEMRLDGELKGRALYLPLGFFYKVVKDKEGATCLIITTKKV